MWRQEYGTQTQKMLTKKYARRVHDDVHKNRDSSESSWILAGFQTRTADSERLWDVLCVLHKREQTKLRECLLYLVCIYGFQAHVCSVDNARRVWNCI